jgi:hypothetical protein
MPTYTHQKTGRVITSARPLTPEELQQLFAQLDAQAAPAAPTSAPLPPPPEEPDTALGTLLQGAANLGWGGLELLGRPGEFVSGFAAGAREGGLAGGLKRGAAAAFEPNLVNSQIQEQFSKTLDEAGILKDSPTARALVGFAGDVVTDPLNLLGGAGIARRGLIAGAGKLGRVVGKADEARQVARIATGVPLGEAFQRTVTPVVSEGLTTLAAKTPGLRRLIGTPEIAGLKGASGQYATDIKRLSEGRKRAAELGVEVRVNQLLEGLDEADKALIMHAVGDPTAPMSVVAPTHQLALGGGTVGQAITQNLTLGQKVKEIQQLLDRTYAFDVARGIMPTRMALPTEDIQSLLDKVVRKRLPDLQQALKAGDPSALTGTNRRIYDALVTSVTRTTPDGRTVQLYDPRSIQLAFDPKLKRLEATIGTKGTDYLPTYRPASGAPPREVSVFDAVKATLPESQQKMQSFATAQKAGAVNDLGEILQRRLLSSERARESARLIERYADEFGQALPPNTPPPPGFAVLGDTFVAKLPDPLKAVVQNKALPEGIVKDLQRTIIRLNDPEALENVVQRGVRYMKSIFTSMNIPSYQLTNAVGNVANMYASGMDPDQVLREYAKAIQVVSGKGTYKPVTFKGGASLPHESLLALALRNGVMGDVSGYATEMATPKGLTPLAARLMPEGSPLDPSNPVFEAVRKASQTGIEDTGKLALFMHEVKQNAAKGLDPTRAVEEAVLKVKNVLFDYAELSDFERARVMPYLLFYTFTRKNIPLQLLTVATRPSRLSNQDRLVNLATELADADVDLREDVPSAGGPGEFVVPGVTTPGGDPILGRARLPMYDAFSMLSRLSTNPLGTAVQQLNPAFRIPAELGMDLATGRGRQTPRGGRPIFEGTRRANVLGQRLGLATEGPRGPEMSNLAAYLTEQVPMPTLVRSALTPSGEAEQVPLGTRLGLSALGLSPQAVDEELRQQAQRDQLERERARMKRILQAQGLPVR